MTVPGATYPFVLGGTTTGTSSSGPYYTTTAVPYSGVTVAGPTVQSISSPYVSVTSTTIGSSQAQFPVNPKRGHRECRECYWWDRDKNMNGEAGYCWHKIPGVSYGSPAIMSGQDWCSFYEPAKQTILSPKWQELMKEKKVL